MNPYRAARAPRDGDSVGPIFFDRVQPTVDAFDEVAQHVGARFSVERQQFELPGSEPVTIETVRYVLPVIGVRALETALRSIWNTTRPP